VIKKPLTMFVKARAVATIASVEMNWSVVSESTIKAATKDTEEIAFVSDIKGVCRRRDTWRISSIPRDVDRIKMSRFTGKSL
jgi:hypothetical protein